MGYGARRRPRDGIHKAVEGDTISSIAASYGITDWEAKVWDASENANLKQERENPNTLIPKDEVFIPELEQKQEGRPTDEWHDFHVVRNKRFLRIKLEDAAGEPLANTRFEITPDDSFRGTYVQQNQTTNAEGYIEEEIPHTLLEAELHVPDQNLRTRLMIGYLLPIPMGEPVTGPDIGGSLGGLAGDIAGAAGGGLGDAVGAVTGALGGAASGGIGIGGGASAGGGQAKAGGGISGGGSLGGGLSDLGGTLSAIGAAAATAVAGPIGNIVGDLLGGLGGDEEDPNVYPAAQRLESMGFDPGSPKHNKPTPTFTAALMAFQTWCKEKGQLSESAGGPLGALTSPGGMLGGGGGPLGAVAGAVAGPMLAAVGLTGQLDDETVEALKKTHGC